MHEYMQQAGRIWSPAVVGLLIIVTYIVVFIVYGLVIYHEREHLDQFRVWDVFAYLAVRVAVLFIYPITRIAYANNSVQQIHKIFCTAAPSDFSVIGGRDCWKDFLNSAPPAWAIYGIWITWDKLFGLFYTFGAAAIAYGLTLLQQA